MARGAWIRNLLLLPSLANPFVRVVFDDRRYRVYPWQSINGETTTMPEWPSAAPDIAAEDQRAKMVAIIIALAGSALASFGALVVVGMLAKAAWDRGGATGGGGGRAPPSSSSSSVDTPLRSEDVKRRQAHGGGPPFGMDGAIEMSSRLGYEKVCCVEEGQVADG